MSEASNRIRVNENYKSFMDDTPPVNPFAPPPDERIFTFKEEEKQRRLHEREKNRNTKIWNKNRPVREGCLKKLCEQDIQMSTIAIDERFPKKINMSQAAEFTIPVERPRNKENRWKLIEKKREMDIIKEMIVTKREETNSIEYLEKKRQEALEESEKFLSQDIKSFVDFFKKNTSESKQAMQDAEDQKNIRMAMHKKYLEKKDQAQKIVSNINKNAELLEEYFRYKQFLDKVSSAGVQAQSEEEKMKEQHEISKTVDDDKSKSSKSRKKRNQEKRDNLMDDLNIKKDINDLIEDDTFKYKIDFDTPADLIANFTTLEEKNLFLIQQTQEAEQACEEKSHELNKVCRMYENDIRGLEVGLQEVKERIKKTQEEMDKDSNFENDQKAMPKELEKQLKNKIEEVYAAVFAKEGKVVESNNSGLYLLAEVEKK
jgi:uncharacterized phage infection (PIP) family protein YhgE